MCSRWCLGGRVKVSVGQSLAALRRGQGQRLEGTAWPWEGQRRYSLTGRLLWARTIGPVSQVGLPVFLRPLQQGRM